MSGPASTTSRRAAGAIEAAALLTLASCVTPGLAPAPVRLAVMSWNVGDATGVVPAVPAIVEVLAAIGWKDVYLFQEVLTPIRAQALSDAIAASGGGPYHVAYSDALRVAVLAREPLGPALTFVAPSSRLGRGALLVRTVVHGSPVWLVDVHLDPVPKSRDESGRVNMGLLRALGTVVREMYASTPRLESVSQILDWLDSVPGADVAPLVVAGDFNTVPSSGAVRLMNQRFVDAASASGHAVAGTYRRVRLPLRPRVDYIFVSPSIAVLDARRVKRTAGDHYPVAALLELPRP